MYSCSGSCWVALCWKSWTRHTLFVKCWNSLALTKCCKHWALHFIWTLLTILKPAALTPWTIPFSKVYHQECRPTPAACTGPQQEKLHCPVSLQIFTATLPTNLGLVFSQIPPSLSEKVLLRIPLLPTYSIPVSGHFFLWWSFVFLRKVSSCCRLACKFH